jgi:hypothetical protein
MVSDSTVFFPRRAQNSCRQPVVIAGTVQCDALLLVNFPLHFRRNVPHLFGVAGYAEILNRDCERVSRRQLRIGKNWRRLLGEGDRGQKQQEGDGSNEHRESFNCPVVYTRAILGVRNYRT